MLLHDAVQSTLQYSTREGEGEREREREREVQRNTIFDSSSNILSYLKSKLAWNVVLFLDKFRRRSLRKKVRMGNTRKYTHVPYRVVHLHTHLMHRECIECPSRHIYTHLQPYISPCAEGWVREIICTCSEAFSKRGSEVFCYTCDLHTCSTYSHPITLLS